MPRLLPALPLYLGFVLSLSFVCAAAESEKSPKVMRGDVPPDVVLGLTRSGDTIKIDQFPGTVRVVTFWASWCAPCRQEIVMLNKLAEVAQDRLKVISVNIEDRQQFKDVTRQFFQSKVIMTNDPSRRAQYLYGVNGIPHMVIVGKDGKVSKVERGYDERALPQFLHELQDELDKKS